MERNISIHGAGEIGRAILRRNEELKLAGQRPLPITHITDCYFDTDTFIKALQEDPVRGRFPVTVEKISDGEIRLGNNPISYHKENQGDIPPWEKEGVWGVFESSGALTNAEQARRLHVEEGRANQVLITAPSGGQKPVKTLIAGFNLGEFDPNENTVADNGSCTTKSVTKLIGLMRGSFGLRKISLNTVHAETGDARRKLLTEMGKVPEIQEMQACVANTGAKQTLAKIFGVPVDAIAYRIPTVDGSISNLTLLLEEATDVEKVRAAIRDGVDEFLELVDALRSTNDVVGKPQDGVIDNNSISVTDNLFGVRVGYDNGYAPAHNAIRTMQYMSDHTP